MPASGSDETNQRVDRRDDERVRLLGELHGEVMVFQPMAIKEIGRGGVQIETTFPLHINSLHELRLTLGEQSLVTKGRVTHCSIADVDQEIVRYRSGLQFTEISPRVAEAISAFIDVIRDARRGRDVGP